MLKLFFIAISSYIFIRILVANARKLKLLDVPNERSYHTKIIPRGGGIGFVLVFFGAFLLFDFHFFWQYWYIFISIFMVFLVGTVDDRLEVSAKLKFKVIFLAVFLMWLNGFYINTLGVWFGYKIELVWWIALPFTMFALAGFTNALNLIDGLDGLSTNISLVILFSFYFVGYIHHDKLMVDISSFFMASLIGFLILNWNPAKVFMGDSGSLTIGFVISVLAVLSIRYIHPVIILYIAGLPILDTLIVMTRRIKKGKSPFSPDKTHIHHILVKFFDNNVKRTVVFLTMSQIIMSAMGFAIFDIIKKDHYEIVPFLALLGFVMIFLLSYMIFTAIKRRQLLLDSR